MSYEPKAQVNLPLMDFQELEFYLMEARPGVTPEMFVSGLLHRWLRIEKERRALRENHAMRGYQWKNVFLPDGTSLRTSHGQHTEFARVTGNQILDDDGEVVTPSSFANRHTVGRNAWRFVWLRFSGEEHWVKAADHRRDFHRSVENSLKIG